MEAAITMLDRGMERLGVIPQLQQYAIALELERKDTEAAIDQGSVGALTGVAAGAALTYAEERRRRRALMRNPTGRPDRAATTGGDVWVDRPRDIGAGGRSSAPRHRRVIRE